MYNVAATELYTVLGFISFLASGVIYWLHKSKFSSKGTIWWARAMFCYGLSITAININSFTESSIPSIVSTTFAVIGYVMFWYGVRLHTDRKLTEKVHTYSIFSITTMLIVGLWYSAVHPSTQAHIASFVIISIPLNVVTAIDIYTFHHKSAANSLLLSVLIGNIFSLLFLGISVYSHTIGTSYALFYGNTISFLYWLTVLLFIMTVSIIMLMVEKLNNKLTQQALEDPLTGLFNRRALHSITPEKFMELHHGAAQLAFLMLDIDHFKRINDNYGHMVGDELLQHFCSEVSGCLRKGDMMFRIGGEEFLIIASLQNKFQLSAMAERVREHVEKHPYYADKQEIQHTVSIGVALTSDDDESFQSTLKRADTALYEAKRKGRNCIACDPDDETLQFIAPENQPA